MNRRQFLGVAGIGILGSNLSLAQTPNDDTLELYLQNLRLSNESWVNFAFNRIPLVLRGNAPSSCPDTGKLISTKAQCRINSNAVVKSNYIPDGQHQRVIKLIKTWKTITAQILAEQTIASLNKAVLDTFLANRSIMYSDKSIFERIVRIHRDKENKGYDRVILNRIQAQDLLESFAKDINEYCAKTGLEVAICPRLDASSKLYDAKSTLIFSRSADDYNVDSWNLCLNSTDDNYANGMVTIDTSFCFNYNKDNVLVAN